MIIIFDGERASGKTTIIKTMVEKAEAEGLPIQSIKPEAAKSGLKALLNWKEIIKKAADFDGLTLIDRGLGSEWVMGVNRVSIFDRELYRKMLLALDAELKEEYDILEFTFLVDRKTQIGRGRIEWENREWDTRERWLSWSKNAETVLIDTTHESPDGVYAEVAADASIFTAELLIEEINAATQHALGDLAERFVDSLQKLIDKLDAEDAEEPAPEPPETFEDLLDRQQELMDILGIDELESLSKVSAAIGLVSEAAEVADILNVFTRPWISPDHDRDHLVEEMADVMFYLLELMLLNGVSVDEFMSVYHAKWQRNVRRALEKKDDAE